MGNVFHVYIFDTQGEPYHKAYPWQPSTISEEDMKEQNVTQYLMQHGIQ